MFSKFNEESRKVLTIAKKEMLLLKHAYIGSEHIVLAVLKNKNYNVCKILNKNGIDYDGFKKELLNTIGMGKEENNWFIYTPLVKRIIEEAIITSRESKEEEVTLEDIMASLFEEGEGVAIRVFLCMNIDIDKLSKEFVMKKCQKKSKSKKKLLIEDYGYNMNEKALNNELDPVIGREEELSRIIEILCRRTKNNPLLIGEAGVGKTAIVEELSKRITDEMVPTALINKRIISISMASLIAGTKYRGEFEERINKMLSEIEESKDIILFIDEIHTLVGAGGAEGAIDASNILKPFLARGKIRLIGATTTEEYKKYLEDDRALARRFQTVVIEEPKTEATFEILKKIAPIYENYHGVTIKDDVLKTIVELSNKYIYNRKQPDKAIDILDEACAKVSLKKDKRAQELEKLRVKLKVLTKSKNKAVIDQNFSLAAQIKEEEKTYETKINTLEYKMMSSNPKREVTDKIVAEVIKLKSHIPVYEIIGEDLLKLKRMEEDLNKKVIGQSKVIEQISKDIKRVKLGYKKERKPRSYLFVGPTGVGKTLLAKEISNIVVKDTDMIRLDMSEFKEEHSISKIIGSPPGYVGFENKNTILDKIKENSNAVILLDEIEKAHPSVVNLFLQALDEGIMKTSTNEVIRLYNNIIIMTSNIGYKKNQVGFNEKSQNIITNEIKETLGIEFVNRIDKVLIFDRLNEASIKKIILKEIDKLRDNFNLDKKRLIIKPQVIENIIQETKYKEFGARRVEKIIKDKLYDTVIDEMLNKSVKITIETI